MDLACPVGLETDESLEASLGTGVSNRGRERSRLMGFFGLSSPADYRCDYRFIILLCLIDCVTLGKLLLSLGSGFLTIT